MFGPHVDIRTLVPRACLTDDAPAYELVLVALSGEIVLIVANDGVGGANSYHDDRVAAVLAQQAQPDFPDDPTPLESLCAAWVDGATSYEEALAVHRAYLDAFDLGDDQVDVDPHVELQLLALALADVFELPFEVDADNRCLMELPGGGVVTAWLSNGDVRASWASGEARGDLETVAASIQGISA